MIDVLLKLSLIICPTRPSTIILYTQLINVWIDAQSDTMLLIVLKLIIIVQSLVLNVSETAKFVIITFLELAISALQ